jgi:predicted negative regulator of RcsB-dependent stress response
MNRPFSAFANLSLAYQDYRRGLYPEAKGYLDLIPEDSFAVAAKHEIRGDILLRQQKTGEAVAAYEQSLAVNSGQRRVYAKLIEVVRKTDPPKAKKWEEKLKAIARFYPPLQTAAVR